MTTQHIKYLLIGAGLTSASAAKAIRERDAEGSLLVIGQEAWRPYNRPPLSKGLLRGEAAAQAELFAIDAQWFTDHRAQLRSGRRAVRLDVARRTVALDDGNEFSFDRLLIATGGSPRRLDIPGADWPNVYYLRTLSDLELLQHAVNKAKAEGLRHERGRGVAAVVGAGVLGVELSASLTQMGLNVHLIHGGPYPWDKFAGEATGRFLTAFLRKHGITFVPNTRPARLEGDGRAQRVVTNDGQSFSTDLVVPAIGMTVNKELLRGSPITAEKAILVDAHCRTNIEGIYAAGDCAAIYDPLFGKHRLMEHWDNAMVSGALAGRNMAGADETYDAVNYFFSDVFDLSLSAFGEARHLARRLVRGAPNVDRPDFIEIGLDEQGRVSQALGVGHTTEDRTTEDDALRALVDRRLLIDSRREHLRDPNVPLATFLT